MKNPNSLPNRWKASVVGRWWAEDYPGGDPRFQAKLLAKDLAVFVLLPASSIFAWQLASAALSGPKSSSIRRENRDGSRMEASISQIIEFRDRLAAGRISAARRRSPGTLVKVRLLNVVETYSATPVQAQIVDAGLGNTLLGGTLIGDGSPDTSFERINITFRMARDPNREGVAFPVAARALSLDGTLGIAAEQKEGFFARSVYAGANRTAQDAQGSADALDLKSVLLKALSAGLIQEFGSGAQVENNRAHVLRLAPGTEFFAELTDYFPSGAK